MGAGDAMLFLYTVWGMDDIILDVLCDPTGDKPLDHPTTTNEPRAPEVQPTLAVLDVTPNRKQQESDDYFASLGIAVLDL